MREIYTNHLNSLRERKKLSFGALEKLTGISDSTLSRWFSGAGNPTVNDLERIFQALGSDIRDVFVEVGEQEMRASEKLEYKGTDAMLADWEQHDAKLRQEFDVQMAQQVELRRQLQDSFDNALATMTREHDKAINQLSRQLQAAQSRADRIEKKRHQVFWGMLAALVLVTGAIVVALFHDAVL